MSFHVSSKSLQIFLIVVHSRLYFKLYSSEFLNFALSYGSRTVTEFCHSVMLLGNSRVRHRVKAKPAFLCCRVMNCDQLFPRVPGRINDLTNSLSLRGSPREDIPNISVQNMECAALFLLHSAIVTCARLWLEPVEISTYCLCDGLTWK